MRTLVISALLVLLCLHAGAADHVHGESLAIRFPDGASVEVQARTSPHWRSINKDATSLVEIYPALRVEAAKGSASAAWVLSTALDGCSFAYADEASLEAAIEHMRSKGELLAPGSDSPTPLRPGTDLAQAEEDLFRRPYRFCRGITLEQRAEADKWLKQSAELGYPPAAITYAQRLGRSNEALRLYEISWRDGKYDAAGHLGRLYELGKAGERQPDPVKSLAYFYVYHRITQNRLSGATTPLRSRFAAESNQDLERRMSEASPEVRAAAMQLAKQLLKENKNCCYGF